jgi:hypothetical protein
LIKLQQGHLLWPANATAGSAVRQADSQLHVTAAQFNSPEWPASTAAALTEARHTTARAAGFCSTRHQPPHCGR